MRRFLCLFAALPVLFVSFSAHAALTSAEIKNFISAIPSVEGFIGQMKKDGKAQELEKAAQPVPGQKKFTPYAKGVEVMKSKFAADYTKFSEVLGKHGFATPENWATTGDSVMQAFLANKLKGENAEAVKAMQQMSDADKAKLPPEVRAQIEQNLVMINMLKDAPAENIAAIQPYIPEINAWLARSEKAQTGEMATKKAKESPASSKGAAGLTTPKAKSSP